MKKIFFILLSLITLQASAQIVANDYSSPITSLNGFSESDSDYDYFKGNDLNISWNSDAKYLSVGSSRDLTKLLNMSLQYGFGFRDPFVSQFVIGLGTKYRYVFNDMVLLQGKAYPYAGFGAFGDDWKFVYGLGANVAAGIKLWTSKNSGNQNFLTIGYYMAAPEFKMDDLTDNGSWQLGLTVILK